MAANSGLVYTDQSIHVGPIFRQCRVHVRHLEMPSHSRGSSATGTGVALGQNAGAASRVGVPQNSIWLVAPARGGGNGIDAQGHSSLARGLHGESRHEGQLGSDSTASLSRK